MTWLSSAPRRLQRSRRGVRGSQLLASALATAQLLAPAEVCAAMQAEPPVLGPRPCPEDPVAAPPSEALALKNAAQEMRAAQSWAKASRLFRDAVEELPDCATYADERLLWTLWAIETFDQAGIEDAGGELLRTAEDAVTKIDTTPSGRLHPDYPRLVSARDRLREGARWRPFHRSPRRDKRPTPLATRLGIGLMASGAPLLISGTIVAGVYSARANGLTDQLTGEGGIYEQWTASGCGPTAEAGEAAPCAGLRDARADIRREGQAVNQVVIASLVMVAVGSAVVLAGLGGYLHGRSVSRRGGDQARLRILPTFGGVAVTGRF